MFLSSSNNNQIDPHNISVILDLSNSISEIRAVIAPFAASYTEGNTENALSVGGAFSMAIYYDNQRPYPTICHPPDRDKWQHCYVGCKIATWFPVGFSSASILAILKEARDVRNRGQFSRADVRATLQGAWACTSRESGEVCCCRQVTD